MLDQASSSSGSPRLQVRRLTGSDFAGMADAWDFLLRHSSADPLFMSWPWLYSWWEVWSDHLELQLALFGVFEDEKRLVGIAPFYLHEFRSPIGFRVKRLQLLGNAWRIQGTVRTEYSGLIAEKGLESWVAKLLWSEVARLHWDEMVVCDQVMRESLLWQEAFDGAGILVRTVPRRRDSGVRIPVRGAFDQWLASLGRNTRLKAYNRRRYLSEKGDLQLRRVAADDMENFLQSLNAFHRRRWGKPCFDEQAVAFHLKLVSRLEAGQLALTTLEFEGKIISVLYDVCAGTHRYNLQAGFLEDFDPKVALGTLHLGYAIEEGFRTNGITSYDLLAGYGKKSFYKSRFQGETVHFLTMQFARNPLMRCAYFLQARLPDRLRKNINRLVGF